MSALERLVLSAVLLTCLLAAGWLGVQHYGAERYDAGYAAAVAAGKDARDAQAAANLAVESDLRARLLDKDTEAQRKDEEHAQALADAQRRVRAGTDRLRCPAAGPVQPAPAPGDRPAAAAAVADREGPDLVPDAAEALLGDAANVAGLVRRYERVIERFEECRTLNAK